MTYRLLRLNVTEIRSYKQCPRIDIVAVKMEGGTCIHIQQSKGMSNIGTLASQELGRLQDIFTLILTINIIHDQDFHPVDGHALRKVHPAVVASAPVEHD
jgi:hypothetical protein